jgi:hypothetical protein
MISPRIALPVSIGLMGAIDTILFARFGLPFWAGLVALAAVLQAGGDISALKQTMIGNAFGSICACVAALIWLSLPMSGDASRFVWGGVVIGAVMIGMCLVTNQKFFSGPALSLHGYGITWAFMVLTPGAESVDSLTGLHSNNALLAVVLAMWAGAILGLAAVKLAGGLSKS